MKCDQLKERIFWLIFKLKDKKNNPLQELIPSKTYFKIFFVDMKCTYTASTKKVRNIVLALMFLITFRPFQMIMLNDDLRIQFYFVLIFAELRYLDLKNKITSLVFCLFLLFFLHRVEFLHITAWWWIKIGFAFVADDRLFTTIRFLVN